MQQNFSQTSNDMNSSGYTQTDYKKSNFLLKIIALLILVFGAGYLGFLIGINTAQQSSTSAAVTQPSEPEIVTNTNEINSEPQGEVSNEYSIASLHFLLPTTWQSSSDVNCTSQQCDGPGNIVTAKPIGVEYPIAFFKIENYDADYCELERENMKNWNWVDLEVSDISIGDYSGIQHSGKLNTFDVTKFDYRKNITIETEENCFVIDAWEFDTNMYTDELEKIISSLSFK